jgi:hypothetical protein
MLGALLVVMLVVVWRQLGPRLGGGSGAAGPRPRERAVAAGASGSEFGAPEVVELRLEDLEKVSGQYSPGRDPFRFGQPSAVVEAPEDPDEDAAREAEAMAQLQRAIEAQRAQQDSGPDRPVLPLLDVTFLGSFGPRQRRLAVFSDGVEIFNVLEGSVLKDHFVIRQIGFESVDVGFVDYPDEPAIRLAAGG